MGEGLNHVKKQIFFVFTYYANFGEKTNSQSLKSHKFHKMMIDCGIQDETSCITSTNLDLLFFSKTKHNSHINFDNFLDLIPRLALEKYPDLPNNQAFKQLMNMNLVPLAEKIMKDSKMGIEKQYLSQEIDEITIRVLEYVAPVLFKIYMVKII